jgi:hypothetical protein
VVGPCKRPDDFINGWSISSRSTATAARTIHDESGNTTQEDDNASMTAVEFQFAAIYKIGALLFGEKGAGEVEREVVGLVWAGGIDCGACGPGDNGIKPPVRGHEVERRGQPGTPAEVIYTVDGGATFAQQNITGLGGTVDPTGIALAGNNLIVLDTAGNGYWYAEINTITGVPGTWTNVTSGFVASKQPTDMYVAGSRASLLLANGGYIYRSTDIASGVTAIETGNVNTSNYQRIHGQDDTIVVVGDSGKIVKTGNRGATWANVTLSRPARRCAPSWCWTTTASGLAPRAAWCTTRSTAAKRSSLQTLPGGTLTVIDDIVAATDEVIHISARTSTPTGG